MFISEFLQTYLFTFYMYKEHIYHWRAWVSYMKDFVP